MSIPCVREELKNHSLRSFEKNGAGTDSLTVAVR
jgi:hypothetical protein